VASMVAQCQGGMVVSCRRGIDPPSRIHPRSGFQRKSGAGGLFLKKGRLGLKTMTKAPFGKVKHFRFRLESLRAVSNGKKSKRFGGESI
jgi:hypothetical protein